ncbi:MAG: phosphoenolpyruvate--protein phosphotransferase [Phycisphaerae bacterium]
MSARIDNETRFRGLPVSPGVTVARVCLFRQARHEAIPQYTVSGEAKEEEKKRLDEAVEAVLGRLEGLHDVVQERVGAAEAEIFSVQRMILKDPVLRDQLAETIDSGRNAEVAVKQTFEGYESRMRELDNGYQVERAGDIGELKRRLLGELVQTTSAFACEADPHCQRGKKRIVVTEELTPSIALEMNTADIRGLVTERGGATSHAAIVARGLGIPAVSGIPHIHDLVACGTEMLVDGGEGEVVVWPSEKTLASVQVCIPAEAEEPSEPVEGLRVLANLSIAEEADIARRHRAEGVGLYRTEMEFFAADRLLEEAEQAERYARVVRAMEGQPAAFRLLDLGGDKPSPLFEFPEEDNPSLGLRGLRYLLNHPSLLKTQARALARASQEGPVQVMYPMVTGVDQFEEARAVFEEAVRDLAHGDIQHGPMFEIPSAVRDAGRLLAVADFASVGSNDLLQYLFAVDRNNLHVADEYVPDQPVFWQVLEDVVRAAREAGVPLSICGELAADPAYIGRLMAIGFETVSVSVRLIPGIRRAAREALCEKGSP